MDRCSIIRHNNLHLYVPFHLILGLSQRKLRHVIEHSKVSLYNDLIIFATFF